ncbi:MAG: UvrD-helicase domain-containing protein, partial [Pseudomonadota bacterium]
MNRPEAPMLPAAAHPTPEQALAADPRVSAWVGANAGSGKTRVLTQRVARLLLEGAAPGRILCLTYTKAAAAEMQQRLFTLLGGWAMAPDAALGAELAALQGLPEPLAEPERLARARRLFAEALETPGGLKIETIHAFCEALLRRFPLEAGVSPRFEILDDRDAWAMLSRIRAEMAEAAEAGFERAFDAIAARLNEGDINGLIRELLARRAAFRGVDIETRLHALYGAPPPADRAEAARNALSDPALAETVRALAPLLAEGGKTAQQASAALGALSGGGNDPVASIDALASAVLTKDNTLKKNLITNALRTAHPEADTLAARLADWAITARDHLAAAETAARARDLDRFARALLRRYDAAKAARAQLDFDDLITRAGDLLTHSDMAAWALYKLDAGIAHVLIDEAQDTAPAQWRVIRAITEEFFAGQGARDERRTVFVVGDEKQSIYSFQGAEPQAFSEMRGDFASRLGDVGARLERPELRTSFRSAPGVLGFVDAVFAEGPPLASTPVQHQAARSGDPARIDLWPLTARESVERTPDWERPVDAPTPGDPRITLARSLAAEIARMIASEALPARAGRPPRPVRPGDILVLVRSRGLLDRTLIRALKGHGVPVAGADRLALAEELAVRDLLALAKAVLNRFDDLSLAAVLRSPLCDVDEEALFALAHPRQGTLWTAVLAAEDRHPREVAMLTDLAARADFLRPYEFLERILIAHDGQSRLLARLGTEAAEVIDELLAQALDYEAKATPTVAGFIAWIE